MAQRLVMVAHKTFAYKGTIVNPGDRFTDPEEIAFVRQNHPEKATASMHDFEDDPDPAPAPVAPAVPVASDLHSD